MALQLSIAREARRLILSVAILCLASGTISSARAQTAKPLTIQELGLMLRSGYTGDEVLSDTAGRPLLQPLDDASVRALAAAGADAHFLAGLKAAHPVLSEADAAEARRLQAENDKTKLEAWEQNQALLYEQSKQHLQAHMDADHAVALRRVAEQLHGKLVTYKNDRIEPYDDVALSNKRLFLLYSSALWCKPCREFTPHLVDFYNKFAPSHPEFETVLISEDKTAYDMENYLRDDAIPWAALQFDRKAQEPGLSGLAKQGIPRLVLIDGTGSILCDSFVDGKYVGPQHVLDDLIKRTGFATASR